MVLGVIPARYGSTRFPGKALAPLRGRTLIQRVWERAKGARRLDRLVVATDDERIRDAVRAFGGETVMTGSDLRSGTDRVWQAAKGTPAEIVVNIQGDEPLLTPPMIDGLVDGLRQEAKAQMATLRFKMTGAEGYEDKNVVKVVTDENGWALYFSRSPIPAHRSKDSRSIVWYKHIGIYAYRRSLLEEFVSWPPSALESAENLEQLRALERGVRIRVLDSPQNTIGVDTPEDLKRVEAMIA